MARAPSNAVPPGWYPDPSGERQWRVWTGKSWSELTRPYGPVAPDPRPAASIPLVKALHVLIHYGVVAMFAGCGLLVSSLAHWPGTAHPAPLWFVQTASDVGVGLMLVGSIIFAVTSRELLGHWSLWAALPGVNVFVVSALVTTRLSGRSPLPRVIAEAILVYVFVAGAHNQPWLCVALVIVAVGHIQWSSSLLDQLWPASEATSSAT